MKSNTNKFGTQIGFLLAAIGSAVGLGNIWRFPYKMGSEGGATFLLIYLIVVAAICVPVLIAELLIGKKAQNTEAIDGISVMEHHAPKSHWPLLGVLNALTCFAIVSYYAVVGGWVLKYMFSFANLTQIAAEGSDGFGAFITSTEAIWWFIGFLVINSLIIICGVAKGIERACIVLMPLLFVGLLALTVYSFTLNNTQDSLKYLFSPDWNVIFKPSIWVSALGQAFFSLSVGMGVMMLYGRYAPKTMKLGRSSVHIAIGDTLVALISAVLVFNIAFASNINPDAGTGLLFVTLPNIFATMPGGMFLFSIFFFLVFVAAITSCIGLFEAVNITIEKRLKISRTQSTLLLSVLFVISGSLASISLGGKVLVFNANVYEVLIVLAIVALVFILNFSKIAQSFQSSYGTTVQKSQIWTSVLGLITLLLTLAITMYIIKGKGLFDIFGKLTDDITIPFAALLTAIFVGWRCKSKELTDNLTVPVAAYVSFVLRYLVPIVIIIIMVNGLGLLTLINNLFTK